MFSKRIIHSARFLRMPLSTQALYFHLGLCADDDGVVEAYSVIKQCGCSEDDLKVLVAKGFVNVLNEDLVSYITDWTENNKIRGDRKIDSIYQGLLLSVLPDVKLVKSRPRADSRKQTIDEWDEDAQWTSSGQPMDSIGEDRIVEDSIDKNNNISSLRSDTLSVRKTDYDVVKEMWNSLEPLGIKAIRNIQSKRHTLVQARLKQYGLDGFREAIENIKMSDFLQGKHSGREWIITFDWFILPSNFPKVLEGNYNNKSNDNHATYGNQYQEEKQWGVDDELRE